MEPPVRLASTGTIIHGVSVGEVLGVSTLAEARLIAGRSGLDRIVQRLNVMEVPDILAWVKPHELLLTTGYPLRNTPQSLDRLVADLDERGLAALAIKLGRYVDELPDEMVAQADRLGFPLILLPNNVGFDDILNQVLTDILNRQAPPCWSAPRRRTARWCRWCWPAVGSARSPPRSRACSTWPWRPSTGRAGRWPPRARPSTSPPCASRPVRQAAPATSPRSPSWRGDTTTAGSSRTAPRGSSTTATSASWSARRPSPPSSSPGRTRSTRSRASTAPTSCATS
ncbi:PucR family transcriptional regulator ligand-binding domain-containing protein [Nonomuraea dietziae]|uniref:PucR family transcriptional regulator ligand-binding domain-containing protein n=1 Tax=Nonomuraea dietziae TaxID=65515 RepID=UPI0031DB0A6F